MGNTQNPVSLSDKGLAAFFTSYPKGKLEFRNQADGTAKLYLVPEKEQIHSLVGGKEKEFNNYWAALMQRAKQNSIVDGDKVFFTKNSKFPRTTFNRYSQKARRVEVTKTATKFVINASSQPWTRGTSFYLVSGHAVEMNHYDSTIKNFFKNMSQATARRSGKHYDKLWNELQGWYVNWSTFNELMLKIVKKDIDSTQSLDQNSIRIFSVQTSTKPDKATFEFLVDGPDLDSLVTDEVANNYLDSLKPKLDEANFKVLHSALSTGDSNITMGFKLLENMDVSNGMPYLYALFLDSFRLNGYNIRRNNSYNSVGVKNLRNTFKLDSLVYDEYSHADRIGKMQQVHDNRLQTIDDRTLFRHLIREPLEKTLEQTIGTMPYKFLQKVNADEDEENTREPQ